MTDAGLIVPMGLLIRRQQAAELGAVEQLQEAPELASMGEVQPGTSASIKSISDSIQSSMACCLSCRASCLSSSFSRLSLSGSRRQLSNCSAEAFGYDKNVRKRDSDESDAPLLLKGEDVAGDVGDVAIGGRQGHQDDHDAGEGLDSCRRVERQPQHHPRNPAAQPSMPVHTCQARQELPARRPYPKDLDVYSQYYRTRTPERQLQIDEYLRRNLNHPGISRMVLLCERDAPTLPEGTAPVEVVASDERITYAAWLRWVKRRDSGIGLLLNAVDCINQKLSGDRFFFLEASPIALDNDTGMQR